MNDHIGPTIRDERKRLGLSIKELAAKVGVSTMTLQRIETGKTSPSVSLLVQIAHNLSRRIDYFLREDEPRVIHIKESDRQIVQSSDRVLKTIVPANLTDKEILVSYGDSKKGSLITPHAGRGHSLVYIFEGKAIFTHDGTEYVLNKGDALYFDARYTHSVRTASKRHKFITVFFKE